MIEFFTQVLINLDKILFNSLGLTIIVVGILPRILLHPLLANSLRYSKALQDLKPKLDEAKKRHGKDTRKLVAEQSRVFREAGINQATGTLGCFLNTVVQLGVFLILFQVLSKLIGSGVQTHFLLWNLGKADVFHLSGFPIPLPGVLVILTAFFSLVQSKMVLPAPPQHKPNKKNGKGDFADALASSQSQTAYLIPVIILISGIQFASGLALYWLVGTLVGIVQQYIITGPGGLSPWLRKLKLIK